MSLVLSACTGPSSGEVEFESTYDALSDVDVAHDADGDPWSNSDASVMDADAAPMEDGSSVDADEDSADVDGHDTRDAPTYDRQYVWTDMLDWLAEERGVGLDAIPLSADCEDGVWNPIPNLGEEAGFVDEYAGYRVKRTEVGRAGAIVCADGIRAWILPQSVEMPTPITFWADLAVPFGFAESFLYRFSWGTSSAGVSDDVRVVLDVGALPGVSLADGLSELYGESRSDSRQYVPLEIEHFVRTEFGWRLFVNWPFAIHIGRDRPPSLCGNGVLDPGEQCDPGLPTGPDDISGLQLCGRDCRQLASGYCDETGCQSALYQSCGGRFDMRTTDCLAVGYDARLDTCVQRPVNEGAGCRMPLTDTWLPSSCLGSNACVPGQCRAGLCVPLDNTECSPCATENDQDGREQGRPRRLIGDQCLSALPDWSAGPGTCFDGLCPPGYSGCDAYDDPFWCDAAFEVACTDYEFSRSRWALDARRFEMSYWHNNWLELPDGSFVPSDQFEFVVEWDGFGEEQPFFETYTVPLPAEEFGEVGHFELEVPPGVPELYLQQTGFHPDADICLASGGLHTVASRSYTHDVAPCQRAFELDGEVRFCPERTTRVDCDGECVDVMNDVDNCGACGTTCDGLDICLNGECVCPPEIAERNPAACDGCPDGFGRVTCDRECLGQIGEGIYCSGNGTCPVGPYGDGVCVCDDGFHGSECQFSCNDGVRNGAEWNVDCGEGCGFSCGTLDDTCQRDSSGERSANCYELP